MKTQGLMIAALIALAGCASEKHDPSASAGATTCVGTTCTTTISGTTPVGTGTDPAATGYATGSTASLQLSGSALGRMFYNSKPTTSATNARINIDLSSATDSVIVSYIENGILHEAAFGTQRTTRGGGTIHSEANNGWIVQNSQNVWKGFFQDDFGAIVIVLDKSINQGDGTATMILGGSIYFQNFQQSNLQNPLQGDLKMCWEITSGPYDCRTFLINNPASVNQYDRLKVDVMSSLYPNNRGPDKVSDYEKLADFAGIDRRASHL